MTPDHELMREKILVYEDLDPAERREADQHLEGCEECRNLLAELRRIERLGGREAALPAGGPDRAFATGFAHRADARASLLALEARIEAAGSASAALGAMREPAGALAEPAPPRREIRSGPKPAPISRYLDSARRRWLSVLIPAAAAAALAIVTLWPRPAGEPRLLSGARVLPVSGMRGAGPGWHTGDAFAIELSLTAPSRVVVFHVDPNGAVALLHPEDPAAPIEPSPSGTLRLPPPGMEWRLEPPEGSETFLIAATKHPALDLAAVLEQAQALDAADREARVHAVRLLLEHRIGSVTVVDLRHEP